MNEILKAVLSLSLSGSLLIFLLFLLRPLYKERLSKQWQYYIWLVVVARLLLPFAPETNLMATLFQGIDRTIEQTEIVSPYTQQGGITDIPQTDDMENGQNNLHSGQTEPVELASNPVRNIVTAIWKNLWLGWLVVALILFIRKITVYQDFVKYIRAGCVEVADIELLERFGKLIERNKVKTTVELYTNNLISSPLLLGFFRPSIVLPSADLSPVDFEYTILHELTHYKRRDMFYKWLVQFSVCVHWFNPLVYLMSREVGRTCELSCDETVIRVLDPHGRRTYGDTLLNAMGAGGNYKNSLASVTLNESKELLKERLDSIMQFKKKSKFAVAVTITLTLALLCGASYTGVYAASLNGSENILTNIDKQQDKLETTYDQDYEIWGIKEKDGVYYYQHERIRIFMDLRTDNSFVNFNYDELGTADIKLLRGQGDAIKKVEYLTEAETDEILKDLDIAHSNKMPAEEDISEDTSRLTKDDVPVEILDLINSCDSEKWYVIQGNKYQYIYYNNVPHNYAWQPEINNGNAKIGIFDIGKSTGTYVLLAVPNNLNLTITYNSKQVPYTFVAESSNMNN